MLDFAVRHADEIIDQEQARRTKGDPVRHSDEALAELRRSQHIVTLQARATVAIDGANDSIASIRRLLAQPAPGLSKVTELRLKIASLQTELAHLEAA